MRFFTVFLLLGCVSIGCGGNKELSAPSTDELAEFVRNNPDYAKPTEIEEQVVLDPETNEETVISKPLKLRN